MSSGGFLRASSVSTSRATRSIDALPHLREVYTGSIAYEIEHISDHAERVWLRKAIETGRHRQPLARDQRVALLERLSETEGFEQYLRRSFLGQKQFSLEGLDALIPMLDEAIEQAAVSGAHEVVIGMAHRGRLNALVHTVGKSYEYVLREFEGERSLDALVVDPEGGSGDVKYHLPARGTRVTKVGEIEVFIAPNPSHLEAVDPVVEGHARAEQTDRSQGAGLHDPTVALAILVHGDASFAGQGIVAETFNLQSLDGYSTGGTLHIITNNQVGYSTDPVESRSTRYSSDLAKGFDVPIVHVNADDPEAAAQRDPAWPGLPRRVRPRLRDRPRRLPAVRSSGTGRPLVHAAAHGRAHRNPADRSRALRATADRRGRDLGGRSGSAGGESHGDVASRPRAPRADDQRARSGQGAGTGAGPADGAACATLVR